MKITASVENPTEGRGGGGVLTAPATIRTLVRFTRAGDAAKTQMEATVWTLLAKVKQHRVHVGNGSSSERRRPVSSNLRVGFLLSAI